MGLSFSGPWDGKLGKSDIKFVDSVNPLGLDPKDPVGQDDVLVRSNVVHLPLDQPVKVLLRSKDVLHNFLYTADSQQDGHGAGDGVVLLVYANCNREV